MKRTQEELNNEIKRVKEAISKTDSDKLKRDYGKHLHRLYKEARITNEQRRRAWQN